MISTLHAACPGCHDVTLIRSLGGVPRCSACGLDYGALRAERARWEAWMLDNLRRGPMGQLAVLHLEHVLSGGSLAESNARVVAFADAHGVALPKGAPLSPWIIAGAILGGMGLLFAAVSLLVM
jgi:hypothetical protein